MKARKPPDHSSPNPEYLDRRQLAEFVGGFRDADTGRRLERTYPTFPRAIRPLHPKGHPRWRRAEVEAWMAGTFPNEVRS